MDTKISIGTKTITVCSWLMIILFFTSTFYACKKDKKDEPVEPSKEIILQPNVVGIDSTHWKSFLISIDSSVFTIVFDGTIQNIYDFHDGDIIVTSYGRGVLRKISSITFSNNQLTITTSPARLSDLIQQGEIKISGSLKSSHIKKIVYHEPGVVFSGSDGLKTMDQTDNNWNIDVVIYDHDNDTLTTWDQIKLEGDFEIFPTYDLYIKFELFRGITEAAFVFGAQENLYLELLTGISYTLERNVNLATIYFSPIAIPLPPPALPILIFPEITIDVGVNGYANSGITTSIEQGISYEAGLVYHQGPGWSTYSDLENTFGFQSPLLTLNAGAKAYIQPEMIFKLYGIVGPYVNAELYGRLEADIQEIPWWKLYAGFNVGAGVRVEVLDWTMLDYEVPDLITWEQMIAQAPGGNELLVVITANITNITETTATGGGEVMTQGNSSVTSRGVCWSTSTNPTLSDPHTTDGTGTGTFVSNITGLTEDTRYFVRAYATNNEGTAYGNEVTFFTSGNLSQGLVAYYPFNGNANDESGNGWNGTVNGPVLINDRSGNPTSAYFFDYNYNNTITTQFPGVLGSNPRTISFWQTSDNITNSVSLSYGAGEYYPYAEGCTFVMFVQRINSNQLIAGVDLRYGGISYLINDNSEEWHHYAIIVPDFAQPRTLDIEVYRDGALLSDVYTMWGDVNINTLEGLNFIMGQFVNSAYFGGGLDDIRIYNRALSDDEIQVLYHENGL